MCNWICNNNIAWFIPLKEKSTTITNAFQKFFKEFNRKPNKIRVHKDSEFYNRSMKSWLGKINIEIYSTHNEIYSIGERFIGTLKNKIYKYMTSISKNVYIDKLDDIVSKYNNTYHNRLLSKYFCMQLIMGERFSFFTVYLVNYWWFSFHDGQQRENFWSLCLKIAEKFISNTLTDCRSIGCTSFFCNGSKFSCILGISLGF